uniref:Uncharacterized protein LOC105646819 n=1 Tax=Rhizophora mucronata TaxID=61149 RepID=A0A2P2LDU6_RHIMU
MRMLDQYSAHRASFS